MYRSEQLVFLEKRPVPIVIRNYQEEDFEQLLNIQAESFPPPFPQELLWNEAQLKNHIEIFPEGAICVEVDGKLASSLTSLCVQFDPAHPYHTWAEITDNGYITNHNANGNTLYIVDICVRPRYRSLGLGKLMMQTMYHIVIEKELDRLLGGGRIPGYSKYSGKMKVDDYVEAVMDGTLHDPVISFLLSCGRVPLAIVENYLEDEESYNYGVLMEWKNPFKEWKVV
jgi:ribosomal protein S18 acetylase RimI-like enzyme